MHYALWELWYEFKGHFKRNPGINTFVLGVLIMAAGCAWWSGVPALGVIVLGIGVIFIAIAVGQTD